MRIRILGSGTFIPDPDRGSASHWVETERSYLRNGFTEKRVASLTCLGPVGLGSHLEALSLAHGPHILDPGFPLVIQELSPGEGWQDLHGDFRVDTVGTRHTENSIGIRISTDDGSLGFTGDTGPDPRLGSFFRGCQVLLAECSHPQGQEVETHLTPPELAALASSASPELLVAVHSYPPLHPREVPSLLAEAGYEGRVLTGWDGLGIDLLAGTPEVLEPTDP